jgi:hypothetical protein
MRKKRKTIDVNRDIRRLEAIAAAASARAPKGTFGPASRARKLTPSEVAEIEAQMRADGKI